jgi:pimeloyl-ACP methyl ester carboxylesterase
VQAGAKAGIEIVYETFGSRKDPALLLIMGLGAQLTLWPESLCEGLANQGFFVVRFDNRDVGLSTDFDRWGVPDLMGAFARLMKGEKVESPYLLADMAADATGLLEALEIDRAHMVVASMGGIAGTQTVTLIIRGLALGQVQWSNARWLLFKEIAVGGLNGLLWALVVGLVTAYWFGTWQIAAIIAAAMLINLLAAAAVGVLVPLALRRFEIDPALSAGVIITTFTDCIGFATLLGLGAIFLT